MLRGRSGINGVMARGCFHVWGGEAPTGMTPDHDYYDPRTDKWSSLPDMPIPIHEVPAMVPHGMCNVGDETVRVVGFFSSNVVVSTFDQPMMPLRQRVVGTPPVLEEDQVPTGEAGA